MTDERLEELLADYVDDVLPADERAAVEAALRDDPALAAQVAQLRRVRRLLRALPDEDAPPALTHAVFAATTRRRWAAKEQRPRWFNFFGPLPVAAAALVAMLAIAGAIVGYLQVTRGSTAPPALTMAKSAPAEKPAAGAEMAKPPAAIAATPGSAPPERLADSLASSAYRSLARKSDDIALGGAVHGEKNERGPADAAGQGVASGMRAAAAPTVATQSPAGKPSTDQANPPPMAPAPAPAGAKEEAAAAMEPEQKSVANKPEAATMIARRWDGAYCGVVKPSLVAAVDGASWKRLWQLLHANIVEKTAEPDLDFEKQAAIAVFMGTKTTGGFATRIVEVRRDGDALRVIVRETGPQPGQMVTESLTQPYSVVVVPREIDGLRLQEDTPLLIERQ
jgi:anti-sigma factor RsiW